MQIDVVNVLSGIKYKRVIEILEVKIMVQFDIFIAISYFQDYNCSDFFQILGLIEFLLSKFIKIEIDDYILDMT